MFLRGLSVLTCTHEGMTNHPCVLLFVTLVKEKIKSFHFSRLPVALHRISADNRWTEPVHSPQQPAAIYLFCQLKVTFGTWGQTLCMWHHCNAMRKGEGGLFRLFHPNLHLLTWIWAIETSIRGTDEAAVSHQEQIHQTDWAYDCV